jgi:hypothetical protein
MQTVSVEATIGPQCWSSPHGFAPFLNHPDHDAELIMSVRWLYAVVGSKTFDYVEKINGRVTMSAPAIFVRSDVSEQRGEATPGFTPIGAISAVQSVMYETLHDHRCRRKLT